MFENSSAFEDACKLILYQIKTSHYAPNEKEKIKNAFVKIMENFFGFECPKIQYENEDSSELFDTLSEDELKTLSTSAFLIKRIENPTMTIDEVLRRYREEIALSAKLSDDKIGADGKKAKGRAPRVGRGGPVKKSDKKGEINLKSQDYNFLSLPYEKRIDMNLIAQKDIKSEDSMFLPCNNLNILYGTVHIYSFFRHFHCLYERLIKARTLSGIAFDSEIEKRPEIIVKLEPAFSSKKEEFKAERYDVIYLRSLRSLLRGTVDASKYEDFCRVYLGSQSYLMFTMDKLIISVINKFIYFY